MDTAPLESPQPSAPHCLRCGAALKDSTLDDLCVACLLEAGLQTPSREEATAPGASIGDPLSTHPRPLKTLGDYELLEEIAHGGMGVVYKARQSSLGRIVALKTILTGPRARPEEIARFRREAEAAAHLKHPHIVAIHHVGEADGQHFFSMDFVEGKTLRQLTRDNPLPAGRAARYLKTIAEAVHYAHQQGVIHRDLKPSNVLIDAQDRPHVTDFGLAKRLDSELGATHADITLSGAAMGTPGYMPPEQAGGASKAVSPLADVYALGAMLYDLLTGRPPHRAETPLKTMAQTVHEEPVSPRQLNPGIPRDLETICLKCLEKDPARRYASALALAEDLARHLNHEPIHAVPPSVIYRARKFVRRHRVGVAVAASFVLVLMAATGVSTNFGIRAKRDQKQAELAQSREVAERKRAVGAEIEAKEAARQATESAQEARSVLKFFLDHVLAAARPEGQKGGLGKNATIRSAVDASEPTIAGSLSDRPLIEASIRDAMGQTYYYLGEPAKAVRQLERALALRQEKLPSDDTARLRTMQHLAAAYHQADRMEEALALSRETLTLCRTFLGHTNIETLITMSELGIIYRQLGNLDEALPLAQDVLAYFRTHLSPDHPDTLGAMGNLAAVHTAAGHYVEAIALLEEIVEVERKSSGSVAVDLMGDLTNLGAAFQNAGQPERAIPHYVSALEIARDKLDLSHPSTILLLNNLGVACVLAQRSAEGLHYSKEAYDRASTNLGPTHRITLLSMSNLGKAWQAAGQWTNASELFEKELEIRKIKDGLEAFETQTNMSLLAAAYLTVNRFHAAEQVFTELAKAQRKTLRAANTTTLYLLGESLLRQAKYAEAEAPLRECVETLETQHPGRSLTLSAQSRLGWALLGQKKFAKAEPLLVKAYEGLKQLNIERPAPGRAGRTREAAERVAQLYEAWGKPDEAAQWREKLR